MLKIMENLLNLILLTFKYLKDLQLEKIIAVGYTATKRLGNAVIRNKSKRIMRGISKKSYYKIW